ncbi:uncharacterized protein LY79DRAFT_557836 [Colletotrichum navitas]|uniref:Uncharacterized protein n=1 Tax=Colletotrichum navitas TaxID=681940 RepID=A0AAD8PWJ8_9PEZI|nr:uncharacterized protein LY79DRAFT_557836 [Colletotrichum navitas]KAK1585807.1 hypothetical protein LY79DRAFT_557836 [Colletotrichum navitas]
MNGFPLECLPPLGQSSQNPSMAQDWLEGQGRQGRQVNRAGKPARQGRAERKMDGDEAEWGQTGRG